MRRPTSLSTFKADHAANDMLRPSRSLGKMDDGYLDIASANHILKSRASKNHLRSHSPKRNANATWGSESMPEIAHQKQSAGKRLLSSTSRPSLSPKRNATWSSPKPSRARLSKLLDEDPALPRKHATRSKSDSVLPPDDFPKESVRKPKSRNKLLEENQASSPKRSTSRSQSENVLETRPKTPGRKTSPKPKRSTSRSQSDNGLSTPSVDGTKAPVRKSSPKPKTSDNGIAASKAAQLSDEAVLVYLRSRGLESAAMELEKSLFVDETPSSETKQKLSGFAQLELTTGNVKYVMMPSVSMQQCVSH